MLPLAKSKIYHPMNMVPDLGAKKDNLKTKIFIGLISEADTEDSNV